MSRLKCPECGLPTIEDDIDDIKYDEMLCNSCYDQWEYENEWFETQKDG